jgi:hypothetical protein
MKDITGRDLRNMREALIFTIKALDEKTDGSDPLRTAIWRGRMLATLHKLGGRMDTEKKSEALPYPTPLDTTVRENDLGGESERPMETGEGRRY